LFPIRCGNIKRKSFCGFSVEKNSEQEDHIDCSVNDMTFYFDFFVSVSTHFFSSSSHKEKKNL